MRGTVHVTAADDHHWLRVALMHRVDAWARRAEKQLGIDDALLERAGELALAAIADEGPLRRARLLRVWQEGGIAVAATRSPSLVELPLKGEVLASWEESVKLPDGLGLHGPGAAVVRLAE